MGPRADSSTMTAPSVERRSTASVPPSRLRCAPPKSDTRLVSSDPPSTDPRADERVADIGMMWMTPPTASAPYRSLTPPRTTSMRSMAAWGTRPQYTQPPNGSFNGTPPASTSVRLAPDADRPRNVTPCVVGLALRDEERRNSVKPGV
jgi:hypothetical protein